MRRSLLSLALLLAACDPNETMPATDTRQTLEVSYVKAPQLEIHAKPSNSSRVVSKYGNGESVSVMSKNGEWTEIRTGDSTGWVHSSDLASSAEAAAAPDNLTPRFRVPPAQVTQTAVHGDMILEANVNTDGEVTSVRTVMNTTGSHELERRNTAALQSAKFYPIVQHGKRRDFIYTYSLHY
ncbi:MAG: SH3 domain-containing protein [Acidobacteria bacterium]|nr:SH3 domain-containing protein [Acidobacteriota bacterium]